MAWWGLVAKFEFAAIMEISGAVWGWWIVTTVISLICLAVELRKSKTNAEQVAAPQIRPRR